MVLPLSRHWYDILNGWNTAETETETEETESTIAYHSNTSDYYQPNRTKFPDSNAEAYCKDCLS